MSHKFSKKPFTSNRTPDSYYDYFVKYFIFYAYNNIN